MNNEINSTKEQKLSLISKLRSKLKTTKIVKKIAGLSICACMAISSFGCSCTGTNNTNNNTSGNSSNSSHSSSGGKEEKISQMLSNILTSEYYNYLLSSAEQNPDLYDTAKFDPHPYAFLNDEGFDVDAIKNNQIACRTQSFVKDSEPNNLYIATYVENKSGNYYSQYLLRYKLTDKEMKEYHMLHNSNSRQFYLEAVFLNNEISKIKEPEVLAETKITTNAHEKLCKTFEGLGDKLDCTFMDVILLDCSTQKQEFHVYVFPKMSTLNNMYSECQYVDYYLIGCMSPVKMDGDIFISPYTHGQFTYKEGVTFENSVHSIKMYHPQNTSLKYSLGQYTTK